MARKQIDEWHPVGIQAKDPYLLKDVKSIVEQTGFKAGRAKQSNLRDRLNALSKWYLVSLESQDSPSPSNLRNQFSGIENAATRLLQNLETTNDADPFDNMPVAIKDRLIEAAENWADRNPGHDVMSDQPPIQIPGEENPMFHGAPILRQTLAGVALLKEWSSDIAKALEIEVDGKIQNNQIGHQANSAFVRGGDKLVH